MYRIDGLVVSIGNMAPREGRRCGFDSRQVHHEVVYLEGFGGPTRGYPKPQFFVLVLKSA
jgi:hypothetical protein